MRRIPIAFALLLLATLLGAAPRRVKVGTLAPKNTIWHDVILDMTAAWEAAGVRVTVYPGGAVGDEPAIVQKMRAGVLNVGILTIVGLSEIEPELEVFLLPRLITDYGELDHVLAKMRPYFERKLEAKGFKVLNWADAGWVHFFAKEPIVSPDDLKGRNVLVWGGAPKVMAAWKEGGSKPVALAATDIHTGLQSGLIDTFATTPVAALANQWFGLTKHMTAMHWAPLIGATVVDAGEWKKLPQEAMLAAAKKAEEGFKALRTKEDAAIAEMRKHGLEVHAVPAATLSVWQAKAESYYAQLRGDAFTPELLAEVKRHRDEYRAQK